MNTTLKQAIRQKAKALRKNSLCKHKKIRSQEICQRIESMTVYKKAHHVGFYHAMPDEVNLLDLLDALSFTDKIAYFPIMNKDLTLTFVPVNNQTSFIQNNHGIFEPQTQNKYDIKIFMLDILFLPVLAFDMLGTRLGMGGGYYDRSLSNKKPSHLVGVAFQEQLYDLLPVDPWDISLDMVVTDETVYCMNENSINNHS